MPKLFCFASDSCRNILIGVERRLWATAVLDSETSNLGRWSKAEKYFREGDLGLFYCNNCHALTTPFIVESLPDFEAPPIEDVWPGELWCWPFKFRPLGNHSIRIDAQDAIARWPFVQRRVEAIQGAGGISAAINITGTTVYVPVEIDDEDWTLVLRDLT